MKETSKHRDENMELDSNSALGKLKGKNSFQVPDAYFDVLESAVLDQIASVATTPVIHKWKRMSYYAVAASVAIILSFIAIRFVKQSSPQQPIVVETLIEPQDVIAPETHNLPPDTAAIPNRQLVENSLNPNGDTQVEKQKPIQDEEQIAEPNKTVIPVNNLAQQQKISNQIVNSPSVNPKNSLEINNLPNPNSYASNSYISGSSNPIVTYASARKAQHLNLFLPKDTCVNASFSYSLIRFKSEFPSLSYAWGKNSSLKNGKIAMSGSYTLNIYLKDSLIAIDTLRVVIVPTPNPTLPQSIEICSHESVVLNSGLKNPNYSYHWSVSSLNKAEILVSDFNPGEQQIRLKVASCTDTVFTNIMLRVEDCKILIPNVFTPNGDGKNDEFAISGIENYPGSSLVIMDRNGKVVFQSLDYKNDWKAENTVDGTYFYSLRIKDAKNTEKGGLLTIIR